MKDTKYNWYISVSEEIYKQYPEIRLTDSQLAKIISKRFNGNESMHLANIRRSRCNDKSQPYVNGVL